MNDSGATGDAQQLANKVVDAAQEVANNVVDLGEEAVHTTLSTLATAVKLLGETIETLSDKLVGK